MGIFSELLNTIPPFFEYWAFIFEGKQTLTVVSSRDKMLPFDQLCSELFYPQSKTNEDTTGGGGIGILSSKGNPH